jgi:hypothetical protein
MNPNFPSSSESPSSLTSGVPFAVFDVLRRRDPPGLAFAK